MKCCLNLIASLNIFKYLYILIGKASLLGFIVVFRKKTHFNSRSVFKNGIKTTMRGGMGCANFVLDFMSLDHSLD